MTNIFRHTKDGSLDRRYLRVSAVYRLIRKGRITSKARAVELLEQRKVKPAQAVVEQWLAYPFKHLPIAAR